MSHPLTPLIGESQLPFNAIPFDQIQTSHFLPAFEQSLQKARNAMQDIREAQGEATFQNTIEALESASEDLDQVFGVFSYLLHADTREELQAHAKKIMPEMASFSNDVYLDPGLFARVKAVYDHAPKRLDQERRMLLEKTYKAFVRNGALLDEAGKKRLREIDSRLAVLGQEFDENLLKSTHAFELVLTDEKDLQGLPQSVIEAAAVAAEEKGKGPKAWVFSLDMPSYGPFLKYCENRQLREKLWTAYNRRAMASDCDNRPVALEISRLRFERARLLGFETHAHFVLEERMASNPATVRGFLDQLLRVSREATDREFSELKAFSGMEDLKPWDFAFYSEKLKQNRFQIDEEEVRQYFKLENVIDGVFEIARRLYGIRFEKRPELPVYHKDVQVFEVSEEATGEHVGLFYADFHPRPSKQGGAWMAGLKDQGLWKGSLRRPHVGIVCNLTKPTPTKPSLLNFTEVRTVFHEFGHALHGLLSRCQYRSLSGTNVYWDFVELPSQIMENWANEGESLSIFARHYGTGAPIPSELIGKLRDSSRFQAGYASIRQLSFGYLDLAWHGVDPTSIRSIEEHESQALESTRIFPVVPGTLASPSFGHIFAGGYSAGYYSYKWAEVLDADAFEFFKEKGIFSREVAERFKNHVLAAGGSEHPMELYRKFRGREPDPMALLRRDGLLGDERAQEKLS